MQVPIGTSSRADASFAARKASRIHRSCSSSCAPCSSDNISFKQRNSDYRFRKNDSQGSFSATFPCYYSAYSASCLLARLHQQCPFALSRHHAKLTNRGSIFTSRKSPREYVGRW